MLFSTKTSKFVEKAITVHSSLYDYSSVIYVNAKTKVGIKCSLHGVFHQTPDSHLRGNGCPACATEKKRSAILTRDIVLGRFLESHGDQYDYTKMKFINVKTKVEIVCSQHGSFFQTPDKHSRGTGCPRCSTANRKFNLAHTDVIKKFAAVHGNLYDYSRVKYSNGRTKVEIVCRKHGPFMQRPTNHLRGNGCPTCGRKVHDDKRRYSTDEMIERFAQVHANKYTYEHVVHCSTSTKIAITCPDHGVFYQVPYSHLAGSGCPRCAEIRACSKVATEWLTSINDRILLEYRLPQNRKRVVDGYDPVTNTVYQFHGDFWHGNPDVFCPDDINRRTNKSFKQLYEETLEKDQYIRELGYNLVVMWESDWVKLSH